MDEMRMMFDHFKKHQDKTRTIHHLLDSNNPIDKQILALMDAQELSIDVISLDPPQKQKKPKQ